MTSFAACLLLLWTLAAPVYCDGDKPTEIKVKIVSDGIELSCTNNKNISRANVPDEFVSALSYEDANTGEYTCQDNGPKIYVKFRTCDNCVELNLPSVLGIVIGNVVATIVIGVAVYLVASQTQINSVTSHKKSSDRQHLVPNEVTSRAPNDHYQPLKHKGGQKDMYDVLTNRR